MMSNLRSNVPINFFLADRKEECRPLRSASKFPVFVFDPFPKNTRKYYENVKEQSAITSLPPSKFTKKCLGQNSFVQFCSGWGTIPFNTCRHSCKKVGSQDPGSFDFFGQN